LQNTWWAQFSLSGINFVVVGFSVKFYSARCGFFGETFNL
jgi:hypothetical protein